VGEPDLDTLFVELANETRRKILTKLDEQDQKLSQLSKYLNLSIQETYRNTTRLANSGLIEKKSDSLFSITDYGKLVIKQIPTYEFLLVNSRYFQEHGIGDIPPKFIHRLGNLKNNELIHGIGPVLEKWKEIATNAGNYLKIITSQYPMEIAKAVVEKAETSTKLSYIFGHNTIVPSERESFLKSTRWNELISNGIVQRKMLKKVQVGITVSESQACVSFPDLRGETDMVSVFFSDNQQFIEWCLDFFQYQCEKAEPFNDKYLKTN